jgi:lipoprotein-anchoring transpeptidase ErfK/SrfK
VRRPGLVGARVGAAHLACVLAALLAGAAAGSRTQGSDAVLPLLIPEDVTIGGVDVGGYAPVDARQAVAAHFDESRRLVVGRRTTLVAPRILGATAQVGVAVELALAAAEGADVPLTIDVNRTKTRAWVKRTAKVFDRAGKDASVRLKGLRPVLTEGKPGHAIAQRQAVAAIASALLAGSRDPVTLPVQEVAPVVTRKHFGPVIVIHRGQHRLFLYRGDKLWQTFGVAVGQSVYPTPTGRFEIVVMWRNPWWYPPDSAWAAGSAPIPPGPGNPLGTRWMGLSAPGVGIHGTPDPASIGYSASHGCIRMLIPQAEWLFQHVKIGTPVFIVPA